MVKCIGVLIYDKSKDRFLLQQRSKNSSYGLSWGVWGGKLKSNETFIGGLNRELKEELGTVPPIIKMFPMDIFHSEDKNFIYFSYIVIVDNFNEVNINNETNDYVWVEFKYIDKFDLHPNFLITFNKKKNQIDNIRKKYNGS